MYVKKTPTPMKNYMYLPLMTQYMANRIVDMDTGKVLKDRYGNFKKVA